MSEERQRFSGRDVAEALAAARRHFGLSRRELSFEIVEGRKVGPVESAGEARVEIEAWPAAPDDIRPAPVDEGPREERGDRRGGGRGRRDDRGPGPGRPRREGRGGRRDLEQPEEESFEMPVLLPQPGVEDPDTILRALSDGILAGLALDLRVESVVDNEAGIRVNLAGDDAELMLEEEAEGLDALQYLANRVLHRDGRLEKRVSYDALSYRAKHEEGLLAKARSFADSVLAEGGSRRMPPMSPYERRLVHVALSEIEGLRTFSKGSGYNRRLHITAASSADEAESAEESGGERGKGAGRDDE